VRGKVPVIIFYAGIMPMPDPTFERSYLPFESKYGFPARADFIKKGVSRST
jgi:hypothetical protein